MENHICEAVNPNWKAWLLINREYVAPTTVNACIEQLERNPARREAALAAFWNAYVDGKGTVKLSEELRERISNILVSGAPDATREEVESLAFIKLHLAGTLAVTSIDCNIPLIETGQAVKALEIGIQALNWLNSTIARMQDKVTQEYREHSDEMDDRSLEDTEYLLEQIEQMKLDLMETSGDRCFREDLFRYSRLLVGGIILVETGILRKQQQDYEDAFCLIAEGACYLPDVVGRKEGLADSQLWLPHSRKPFDMEDVAELFELLLADTQNVKDWGKVASWCEELVCPSQELGPYDYSNLKMKEYPAPEFWDIATEAAKLLGSQSKERLWEFIEENNRRRASQRLEVDIFPGGLWGVLEETTRGYLVQAEETVENAETWEKVNYRNMLESLRLAVESELPEVFPLLAVGDDSPRDPNPITKMAEKLKNSIVMQDHIRGLKKQKKVSNEDIDFVLEELADRLRELARDRNHFSHPGGSNKLSKHPMQTRREWLGIDQKGVFPCLARIKKACNTAVRK